MNTEDVTLEQKQILRRDFQFKFSRHKNYIIRNLEIDFSYDLINDTIEQNVLGFIWGEEPKILTEKASIYFPKDLWNHLKQSLKRFKVFSFLKVDLLRKELIVQVDVTTAYPELNRAFPKDVTSCLIDISRQVNTVSGKYS